MRAIALFFRVCRLKNGAIPFLSTKEGGFNMNNELFTMQPSLKQYYGRTITKETAFDEYNDDKTIHQTLKDLKLITEINKETAFNGIKSTEKSVLTQELPEGTVLIWQENQGYIIPVQKFYKIKDLEEEIQEVRRIYKDNTDMNHEV